MIGLVLVSHGNLANEFREAVEHVMGAQAQLETVAIGPEDDIDSRRGEILAAAARVDTGEGVIICTDMFGGTPSNLAIAAMGACEGDAEAARPSGGASNGTTTRGAKANGAKTNGASTNGASGSGAAAAAESVVIEIAEGPGEAILAPRLPAGGVEVLAGMNLPMLVKLAGVRDREALPECALIAQEAGRKYINVASRVLNGR